MSKQVFYIQLSVFDLVTTFYLEDIQEIKESHKNIVKPLVVPLIIKTTSSI